MVMNIERQIVWVESGNRTLVSKDFDRPDGSTHLADQVGCPEVDSLDELIEHMSNPKFLDLVVVGCS